MDMEQRTANQMSQLGAQLRQLCGALPNCHALDPQLQTVREEALADLYVTLQDLSRLYYEARLQSRGQTTSQSSTPAKPSAAASSGRALADYLFAHPDRCDETLRSLGGEFAEAERSSVFKKHAAKPDLSDFDHAPVFKTNLPNASTNEHLSR